MVGHFHHQGAALLVPRRQQLQLAVEVTLGLDLQRQASRHDVFKRHLMAWQAGSWPVAWSLAAVPPPPPHTHTLPARYAWLAGGTAATRLRLEQLVASALPAWQAAASGQRRAEQTPTVSDISMVVVPMALAAFLKSFTCGSTRACSGRRVRLAPVLGAVGCPAAAQQPRPSVAAAEAAHPPCLEHKLGIWAVQGDVDRLLPSRPPAASCRKQGGAADLRLELRVWVQAGCLCACMAPRRGWERRRGCCWGGRLCVHGPQPAAGGGAPTLSDAGLPRDAAAVDLAVGLQVVEEAVHPQVERRLDCAAEGECV
jgi:hypothetical protein